MIDVSDEFRQVMEQRRDFRLFALVTLTDGTELSLDGEDFTIAGNRLTDRAGTEGLPLGAAISRQATLEIINDDEHLNGYDFFGARVRLWLTLELSDSTEKVELGTFTVTEPASRGETVSLTAGDDMVRTDRPYETSLAFPATLGSMYRELCQRCSIPYDTAQFPNEEYVVAAAPSGEDHTFRQVLGYIAMLAGGNARVDRTGRMRILPYGAQAEPVLDLDQWGSLKLAMDDITVTGLSMTVYTLDENGESAERTELYGREGYVLQVENPLVAPGGEQAALALMGAGLIGRPLRRFEGTHAALPMAEFMDTVRITDRRGRTYDSVLTDVEIAFGGYTSLSNSAEPAVTGAGSYDTPRAQARQAARELVERERTARQAAVGQLAKALEESGGMFSTAAEQPDGSVIYYLHDRPDLAGSRSVMKLTADAIGFSTDGGQTWPFGFSVNGEMIMGIIRSEGLSADWVRFGTLEQARVEGLPQMASDMQVMREEISAAVTELETSVSDQVEYVQEQTASLTERADEITASVSDIQQAMGVSSGQLQKLQGQISSLQQTASELSLRFDSVEVDHVTTSTGYTFNEDGLDISKAGEEMHNQLTNLGMYVRRNEDVILRADASGVEATDVRINNFLLLGSYSRFEDYTDGADGKRTACFFVG